MAAISSLPALLLATSMAHAQVERITTGEGGAQANGSSYDAAVSANGQVVAFRSTASNLVAGDDNGWPDIFVRDLASGTTEKVSGQISPYGTYSLSPSISGDGQVVVMTTYLPTGRYGYADIVIHDRATGTSALPFMPNGAIYPRLEPSVSGDGQFIAFYSTGSMQEIDPPEARPVDGDTNSTIDAFVVDRVTTPMVPIQMVSRASDNVQGVGDSLSPTLSHDGRYAAFYSYANNLVAGDTNEHEDVFVKDRQTGALVIASVASDGTFGNGDSVKPVISGNGRFVVFRSQASNLVPDDSNKRWDIFVRDLTLGTTTRVSVASDGTQGNNHSFEADISNDGRFVVFRSNASNLVPGDTNQRSDIFVHDRQSAHTARVSQPASGESNGNSYKPVISGDGLWIAFESDATNLVAGDSNTLRDIFRVANPFADGNAARHGGR